MYIVNNNNMSFLSPLLISGKLAVYTTFILLIIGMPVAYFFSYFHFKLKPFFEALVSMPMVLPPTVMGFYVLTAYSPNHWFGHFIESVFDVRLAFSFPGILIASVIFSMPFMIQPLQNGLSALPESYREAAYTMGKSPVVTFFTVLIPNIKGSIVTAVAMTFAHCMGEFGVVLMVGGNMPGITRVASIAIYDEVQEMNYSLANKYAMTLFIVSFILLAIIYSINNAGKAK